MSNVTQGPDGSDAVTAPLLATAEAALQAALGRLTGAEARMARICSAASEQGVPCSEDDAAGLVGRGSARQNVREAALWAAALEEGCRVAPFFPAHYATSILVAFATGSGGGWAAPGTGTARCAGDEFRARVRDLIGGDLARQGGIDRWQAASGPAWTAAADYAIQCSGTGLHVGVEEERLASLQGGLAAIEAALQRDDVPLESHRALRESATRLTEAAEVLRRQRLRALADGL